MSTPEATDTTSTLNRLRQLFTLRLRPKLIIPYALLAAIVVIAGAYLIASVTAGSLQERFDRQLHDAGVQVADGVVEVEQEQLTTLRAIVHTEGLVEALLQEDAAAIRDVVLPLTFNAGADCVEVVSLTGQGLFAMHRRQEASTLDYDITLGTSYASWMLVQRVSAGEVDEAGDKFADWIHTDWGDVFYVAGPAKVGDRLVGVVLVGTYLDQLTQRLDETSLARVTLYDLQGQVLATSTGAQRDRDNTTLTPDLVTRILEDQRESIHRRSLTVGSVEYVEAFAPFEARHGRDLGVLSVALSRQLVADTGSSLRQWLIVLLGIALVAIVTVGLFLGAHITRPIRELVQATNQVAQGNLETSVPVRSDDEIGMLAQAFNRMVQGLRERDFIKDAFGRLVAQEVREQILSGEVKLQGESRVVTTLFTDIREFTHLSEKFEPTVIVNFLNEFFTVVIDAVDLYGGTVNKFGGDSTLVIFGAPQHHPDHACRAIQAGLEIRKQLGELNARRLARGDIPIHTGIGINTGEVVAGTIGSEQRMEYTVIGDAVNVSARIQGLTKEYMGQDILVSEVTYEALGADREKFRFQELGQAAIRGKREPVRIYGLIDWAVATPFVLPDENRAKDVSPTGEIGHAE